MAERQRSQQATLGCGTLILIGIVVLFVTQGGFGEIDESLSQLRGRVEDLHTKIQRLELKIDKLTERSQAPAKNEERK